MNRQIPINSYFDVFEQLVCNFLYNAMYLFSVLQIKYKRLVKPVEYPLIRDRTDEHKIELFYEGDAIQLGFCASQQGQGDGHGQGIKEMTKLLHFLQNKHGDVRMNQDALIVYTNPGKCVSRDKVILRNGDTINILSPGEIIFDYKRTSCNDFLSFEMVLEDLTTHPIQLDNGDDNYYIVGNVIDRSFIAYYSKKYLKLSEAPQKYTLHIVDGNANFFTITQDDTIWFEESSLGKSG